MQEHMAEVEGQTQIVFIFSHEIGVKIGVKNTKLSPFPWGFPKKVIFKSAPKVVVINDYGR